jgi:signal peptidase II
LPKADVAASSASTTKVRFAALGVLALVAVCIYALDQVTKYLIVSNLTEYERVPVLGEFLQLYFVNNPGAAFSIGSGSTWIFAIIASAVVVFIVIFSHRIRSLGWAVLFGLLLGGNAGNLTDRLTREPGFGIGHVVDFIQLWIFPAIFNIADMAIVFSMVIFVILTVRGIRLDGSRTPVKTDEPAPAVDGIPPVVDSGARADAETPADSQDQK